MRLSLRKPEFDIHSEIGRNIEPQEKDKASQKDAANADLMFFLKEDAEFCRKSLR